MVAMHCTGNGGCARSAPNVLPVGVIVHLPPFGTLLVRSQQQKWMPLSAVQAVLETLKSVSLHCHFRAPPQVEESIVLLAVYWIHGYSVLLLPNWQIHELHIMYIVMLP